MKSILQTFVFLLLLTGASSLWGQCTINPPTVTGTSCNSKSTDSPSDDAIQFNLNVTSTSGSANGFWIDVSGGTNASPQQGTYGTAFAVTLGSGTAGSGSSYTVTLTDKADLSCRRTFVVGPVASCSAGCSTDITYICDNGSTSATLTAMTGLTNVLWFNSANQQVGSGSLQVTINTPGMSDGMEEFYYTATDGTGCLISLCCPIKVATQDCGWLDLALTKTKSNNTPAKPGETVTFNIQVCNQGTDPATSVSLIDYIPSGFTFTANNGWVSSGANATRTITPGSGLPTGGLLPNACVTIPIGLVLNSTATPNNILNIAEITAGTDTRGRTTDIDSTPDSNPNNDAGGAINTPSDNALNGDGTGTPGSNDPLTDEDDADPATVRLVDLALKKEIVTAGPYTYGQAINFLITVQNQGNETATSINISDYVPDGYAFAANNGWTGSSPLISRTIAGPLAPGASTTVNLTLTLKASQMPNAWLNFAEISAFNDVNGLPIGQYDIDSTPDSDPSNDAGGQPNSPADNFLDGKGGGAIGSGTAATDEDDHDPALVNVFDLALTKTLNTAAPYTYGQTHSFTVTVYNQGNVAATNVVVSDYIPAGYSFVANNGWTGAAPTITNTIAGPIAPGASATLTLNLTFNQVVTTSAKSWINYSEITSAQDGAGNPVTDADSTPGSNGTNENAVLPGKPGDDDVNSTSDTGVGSQDDHDPAGPWVFDLALTIGNGNDAITSYGQNMTFPVAVVNQGNISSQGYTVSVKVPSGFNFGVNPGWTYDAVAGVATYVTTTAINPGQTNNFNLILVSKPSSGADAWTVFAEISKDNPIADEVGIKDIDSTPDTNFANDGGGAPIPDSEGGNFPGNDDILTGVGGGTPGDTVKATDEDDHDPEYVKVFDLALTKTLNTAAPYTYGQTHSFTVTVFNQGNVTATDVVVSDYIPAGYSFVANNGWTGAAPTITNTIAGPIAPGASATLTLELVFNRITNLTSNKSWVNYAEITSAKDNAGNPATDVDSTPGSNGANENAVLPDGPGDNDTASTTDGGVGSQDDHDPAGPKVFDLALRKTKLTALPSFSYGQNVMYKIELFNQGNIAATNIDVTDYLPCGLQFVPGSAVNSNWTQSGNTVKTTFTGILQPGQTAELFLDLRVVACYTNQNTAWTNYAEISKADDTDPNTPGLPVDIDSTPDANNGNDNGGVPDFGGVTSGTDDTINNENGDEDDHDPVKIEIFDLALRKVLATNAPYSYGQPLTFNVEVFNQGNVTATNILVSDYVPAGYTFAANNGWTGGPSVITRTVAGPLAPGASTGALPLVLTLQMGSTATAWDNYAEVSAAQDDRGNNRNDDADSVADNNPNNDNPVKPGDADDDNILGGGPNANQDQDDHDPAAPKIIDIALRKTTVTAGPYTYGQVVSFQIDVINQGNVVLTDIDVVDYIPCGFEYVSGSQAWTVGGAQASTMLAGTLMPTQVKTLIINLRVKPCYTPNAWLNYAEVKAFEDANGNDISNQDIDSTPDTNKDNDAGGLAESPNDDFVNGDGKNGGGSPLDGNTASDEDDQDPELIRVFDLALRKQLVTTAPYVDGQPLTFNITVFNQGNEPAYNVVVNDYVPIGYTYSAGLNPGWSTTLPTLTYTIPGPIAPGASASVSIVLNIEMTMGGAKNWINYAEIGSADNDTNPNNTPPTDADSTPNSNTTNEDAILPGGPGDDDIDSVSDSGVGSQDDHDPAGPRLYDMALRKTTTATGPFFVGNIVKFDIEVINQGNFPVRNTRVVDYIPSGFEYVGAQNFPTWTFDPFSGNAVTTIPATLQPGQSTVVSIYLRVKYTTSYATGWDNVAEIFRFEDTAGNDVSSMDIDSRADSNPTNDAGGEPEGPSDDYVNGDGTGPVGSGPAVNDEDDQDPERIEIFDLALRKTLVTSGPYKYGQLLEFDVTVFNQGNEPATNVEITDYVPAGYGFSAANNAGWSGAAPTVKYTIAGPIAVNGSQTVKIFLTVLQTTGGEKNWINYSEITKAADADGNDRTNWDIDSNPSSNNPVENSVEPGDVADNNIDSHDKGGEEDDHDPAGIEILDLAQRKVIANQTGPYVYGDQVTFTIEVFNQGSISAKNIEITDYIPCGFKYRSTNNAAGWSFDPVSGRATRTLAAPLAAGASTTVTIALEIQQCLDNSVGSFTNYTEISKVTSNDPRYPDATDIDSTPDNNPGNDPGGQPDTSDDDEITGDPNNPSNPNAPQDEDDHDPERIEVFDLALKKELVSAGPYKYGQMLDFNITVCNQGNVNAANVVVSDYLPAGYGFAFANNPGWAGSVAAPTYTIPGTLVQDQCAVIPMKLRVLQTTGGEKNWVNYAEITSSTDTNGTPRVDADSNEGSNNSTENGVEPGDPADDNMTSTDKGGEEDDHDPAGIEIFDLAQRKTTVAAGPFRYGDVVKFTYEVFNQGSVQASSVKVKDFIPCGFKYVAASNNTLGWTFDAVSGNAEVTLTGAIVPGASKTVDIFLQVIPCIANSNKAWTNIGEITGANSDDPDSPPTDIDSTPDNNPGNDPGGQPDTPDDDEITGDPNNPNNPTAPQDEDDHDPERIEVVDLALNKKMVTAGPYKYGQIIDFNIEVFNQGNVTMTNIEVVDYLPAGFEYDPSINPGWNGAAPQIYTIIAGPLAPEASTSVTVRLKLIQTNGGGKIYTNGSEISGMDDTDGNPRDNDDADSTPDDNPNNDNPVTPGDPNDDVVTESPNNPNTPGDDDEDDSDPAGPKVFDLALRKVQLTAGASFSYGQTVMYGIQVYNQGNVDAKDIRIVDTLPCGLEFLPTSAVNIAAGWVYNPATREVRATYSNVLVAGTNTQLSLDVRVVPCYSNVNNAWTNYAEIEGADDNDPNTPNPPVDIDSTPDGNNTNDPGGVPNTPTDDEINGDPNNPNNPGAPQDEDDQDPHKIQIFDLALRKTVDNRGPYMLGQTATFRISLFNQGNVAAKNILVKDYLRTGFIFNAGVNPGWSLVGSNLEYTYAPTLLPGDSITLPLLLDITVDATPNVKDWWNYAEIAGAQDLDNNNRNDDADSTPNSNTPYENQVEPDGPYDNVINGNGPNFNQDEDDHDPEKVIVVGGLGDTVFKDLDGDGIQDPGEPGVGNVVATLTDCNGNVLATQTTDANGFYFFNNLIPGDYQVQFDISRLPLGCAFTFQDRGGDDAKDSDVNIDGLGPCTNIGGGEFDSTYDAGLLILAAIGDFVWHDLNGDGVQGSGEPGIPGVQVNLYKGDGTFVGTRYTDANGYYLFDFLYPGDYFLEFIDPTGFDRTFQNIGDDAKDSDIDLSNGPRTTATTYLAPGERDLTWDAGYYKCIPIGELVWYDINKNDLWNTNENGINGLTVNLWRNHFGVWTIWDVTSTGNKPGTPSDDGYWKFCAPPGQYYVEVVMPPLGLVRARPNIGNNELIDSDLTNQNGVSTTDRFTVISGQTKCDIGAGFYPMAVAGNLVWMDANMNGVQEANEPRLAGVKVAAISIETGETVSEAVTDTEGIYSLEYLRKEDYYLHFTPPAGYSVTLPRATSDDMDSDVDHTYGLNTTRMFSMEPSMINENIDMGVALGVLPVTWLDVNAKRVNSTHQITWRTSTEVNTSHYVVERRLEGQADFAEIPGQIKAAGNSTAVRDYVHFDTDVEKSGMYQYRVKQVDFDGKYAYSRIVKVSHNGENSIDLYPNPAKTTTNIQVVLSNESEVSMVMYDNAGRLVRVIADAQVVKAGDNQYSVDLSTVPAGVYNVVVTIDGVATQKKLIRIE